jgi:uncharacterized membrane protein
MPSTALLGFLLAAGVAAPTAGVRARPDAGPPTVRAVLFFSPTCPHCHQVIQNDLPRIFGAYGGNPTLSYDSTTSRDNRFAYLLSNGLLEILLIDATIPAGDTLYAQATRVLAIPTSRSGVPRLVIGDSVLVGSDEIPRIFPALIDRALAAGGMPWPRIPGLASVAASLPGAHADLATASAAPARADTATRVDTGVQAKPVPPAPAAVPQQAAPPPPAAGHPRAAPEPPPTTPQRPASSPVVDTAPDTVPAPTHPKPARDSAFTAIPSGRSASGPGGAFARDPIGNGLAVLVLLGMIVSLVVHIRPTPSRPETIRARWAIPVLAAAGAAIAAYLTYVETRGVLAVCGPVGDCNAVQQSPYANVFGVVPVGALGLAGYALILALWLAARRAPPRVGWVLVALFAVAYTGTAFSAYLTFLEPFVIGATCMWCLTSSVIITLLLWLSAGSRRAVTR